MADKVIAVNKKAAFEYFIEESFEAGIVLSGCEVKSVRGGNVNLSDSFCFFEKGEPMLKNCYIAAYEQGSYNNADTRRDRKLLLHKRQIVRLLGKIKEKGYALVPLKVYLKNSLVKVELGLGKGKKSYDKKQTVRERDIRRSAERDIAAMKKAGRIR